MAKIHPFKAFRPTRDKVSLVTSRSYEEYSAAELASQLDFNPLSFLHILNPAYTNQQKITFERRFKLVHQKYQDFKDDRILVRDEKPAVYVHRIKTDDSIFTGIILATTIEDYKNGLIKKHEDTLQYRVELFKDYMNYAGFNTEPVLMNYPDNALIDAWLEDITSKLPDFEFATTIKDIHYLWKVDDLKEIEFLQNTFDTIGDLYIADGHHRSASANMLYDEQSDVKSEAASRFMSYLIADSNVKIYEYNRLIKDLNGLSKEEFIERLSENFVVEIKTQQLFHPSKKHEFGMYLENEFYSLTLKLEKFSFNNALQGLDAQILYDTVLLPILGISDLRNDERIDYIPGKKSVIDIKKIIDSEEFELGFVLFPANITEIKSIADSNLIMPPKSTYIEPKFRSGLVIYEL